MTGEKSINIYLCGVGGQGIGLLSEVLSRACLDVGYQVRGCDTHGLAQRGGVVVSHLRLGANVFTPQVPEGEADLVVALERLEALRATRAMLRPGGAVFYYDARFQPIHVRMGQMTYPTVEDVEAATAERGGTVSRVFDDRLPDPRMQNVALLGRLAVGAAIPGVDLGVVRRMIEGAVPSRALDDNLEVFERASGSAK